MTAERARLPDAETSSFERPLPVHRTVAYYLNGVRFPVRDEPADPLEIPAFLRRGDGSHVARLLALPPHMPGSPTA